MSPSNDLVGRHDHDVIVVGGGHNGLIAAAYLARAGLDVVVLEARETVGGCASTDHDLGARFNICNCDHIAIRTGPVVDELGLAEHGLRYLDIEPGILNATWDDSRAWPVFHDVDRTCDVLAQAMPDQVEGYRRYVRAALPVVELVTELANAAPTAGSVARRVVGRRGKGARTLLAWSRRSALDVLSGFFTDERMIAPALATGPMVWGLTGSEPGTGLGATVYAMRHHAQVGRPAGGSGALPDAVAAALVASGGSVRTGCAVEAVLCEERGRGVRLVGGEELTAAAVVNAADPRSMFVDWLSAVPAAASLVDAWSRRPEVDGYESKVDAVVRELPQVAVHDQPYLAAAGIDPLVPTSVVAPSVAAIADAHRLAARGRVAERPMMLLNVPTVADPSLQETAGEHVLSLEVLFTPYALEGGWADSPEPARWLQKFGEQTQPGWSSSIRDWRAMTPDRYEREFRMRRGHAVSYSGTPLASLLGRDRELSRYRTPIDGVYQTGAATYPGAGIWGASGRNAAHAVLADLA